MRLHLFQFVQTWSPILTLIPSHTRIFVCRCSHYVCSTWMGNELRWISIRASASAINILINWYYFHIFASISFQKNKAHCREYDVFISRLSNETIESKYIQIRIHWKSDWICIPFICCIALTAYGQIETDAARSARHLYHLFVALFKIWRIDKSEF